MKKVKHFSVVVMVALAGLSGCAAHETSAAVQSYRVGPGGQEITVVYLQGPDDAPGHVEILDEGPESVRVEVLYRRARGTRNMIGSLREAVGSLREPLADREVLDRSGAAVPLK